MRARASVTQTSDKRNGCKPVSKPASQNKTISDERFWNEVRIDRLISLWNDGTSPDGCAADLKTTKNAILSKIRALRHKGVQLRSSTSQGLDVLASIRRNRGKSSATKQQASPQTVPSPRAAKAASADRSERIDLDMELPEDRTGLIFDILQLEPHHCRWVLGDPIRGIGHFAWCGQHHVPGTRWCATHYEIFKRRRGASDDVESSDDEACVFEPA